MLPRPPPGNGMHFPHRNRHGQALHVNVERLTPRIRAASWFVTHPGGGNDVVLVLCTTTISAGEGVFQDVPTSISLKSGRFPGGYRLDARTYRRHRDDVRRIELS